MIKKIKFNCLKNLQQKIKDNNNILTDFNQNIIFTKNDQNSCFDFHKCNMNFNNNVLPIIDNSDKDIPEYKSIIVDMKVNKSQKQILNTWFDAYIQMYNATIQYFIKTKIVDDIKNLKFIINDNALLKDNKNKLINERKLLFKLKSKNTTFIKKNITSNTKKRSPDKKNKINEAYNQIKNIKLKIKEINKQIDIVTKSYYKSLHLKKTLSNKLLCKLNWKSIRTNKLKNIRDNIQIKSSLNIKNRIKIHILDTAIKLACTSYKSCSTNYLKGNVKRFRIKYWRFNKNNKILEVEKEFIRNGKLFNGIFGDFKLFYNKEKYILESDTVKILYKKDIDKYYLLVSRKIDKNETKSKKYIGIDLNIKPFMACRTNDELLHIGTNTSKIVGDYLKRIDNINNANNLSKKDKRKKERKYYLKIKNKVDEIHWKTIKYITDNYGYVIIGNLSMKDASSKKDSKIPKKLKRIGLMMGMSKFRSRLEYKCLINGIKISIVNEAYTSKVCSHCGTYKKELKGEKIYECKKCNVKRDRDLNSATNMILLTL